MPEDKAEVRPSVTVVTSENLLEFQNKKLDEKLPVAEEPEPEEKKDAKPEEKKAEEKPVAEDEKDEEVKTVRKGNPKIERRFSELTEARKAAEAKASQERERAEAAEAKARELELKLNPPPPEELGPEPTPDQFSDTAEYAKALKDWTAETTKRDLAKENQEKTYKAKREQVIEAWKGRVEAAKKEIPDYEAKLNASTVKVSDDVRDAILESDVGPQILIHFADHPEEAERISKLSVGGALRELGRLEAKLEKSKEKEPENPVTKSTVPAPVAEVSKAPAPIAPLRGANKPVETRVDSNGVYHGSYQQYKKDRAAGKIK